MRTQGYQLRHICNHPLILAGSLMQNELHLVFLMMLAGSCSG
jgi:hypothetical protein